MASISWIESRNFGASSTRRNSSTGFYAFIIAQLMQLAGAYGYGTGLFVRIIMSV